ncbi:hypothetical protein [Alcaligenes sp. SDU_A2]|uniref:hypothetical protein n=1 Tax=Alcaligenes sp. SDU_A2 TaxID=3136634 RepID=UPI00311DF44E
MTIDTKKLRTVINDDEVSDEELVQQIEPEKLLNHIDAQEVEIKRLKEALYLALEYWAHRQQRYKNRSPVWVQKARDALSGEPNGA